MTPSPTTTVPRRDGEARSDTKPYFYIYLYTYIYFGRKEQEQEESRPRAASFCPLQSQSWYMINRGVSTQGRGLGVNREGGALYAHAGLRGGRGYDTGRETRALRGPMYSLKLGGD